MEEKNSIWNYLYVPILLSILIIIISVIPLPKLPELTFIASDKLGHLLAFGLLMFSYLWAFNKQKIFTVKGLNYIIFSLLICIFIGGGTELLQSSLPINRFGDIFDFYFDIAGIVLALVLFMMIKKYIFLASIVFLFNTAFSQQEESSQEFQNNLNKEFSIPEDSPLDSVDLLHFKALEFFPIDEKYIVKAKLVKQISPVFFEMETTTARRPKYRIWGFAYFTIDGKELMLTIFQNKDLMNNIDYYDYLFLPFTDLTNGTDSYLGGRYVDLRISENDEIIIDFNKSYNPYCAYSNRWSCPIVPSENALDIEIKAGVKKYH